MWESSFEGALGGTSFCNRAPVSTRRGAGMTDDRKKRTNLENAIYIYPTLFGKEPSVVNWVTFCVNLKPKSAALGLNDDISIKC